MAPGMCTVEMHRTTTLRHHPQAALLEFSIPVFLAQPCTLPVLLRIRIWLVVEVDEQLDLIQTALARHDRWEAHSTCHTGIQ